MPSTAEPNAGILAAKILATSDAALLERLKDYSRELKEQVEAEGCQTPGSGLEELLESKDNDSRRLRMDYKNAGVDIEAGYKSVELMKQHVQRTMRPEVLGGIGGFSGAFSTGSAQKHGGAHPAVRNGRRGNQTEAGVS